MTALRVASLVCLLGLANIGCGTTEGLEEEDPTPVVGSAIFWVPDSLDQLADEKFYDQPWPSDLRREADNTVRFAGFPNPRAVPLIDLYADSMSGVLTGFSPAAAGVMRFGVSLDEASLPPDPPATLDPRAAVQMVDIDRNSPEFGKRHLIQTQYRDEAGVYWPERSLSVMPALGYPLRPATRYAVVVLDGIRALGGGRPGASPSVRQLLGLLPADGAHVDAAARWQDAVSAMEEAGVPLKRVVHFSVFTTDDPVAEARTIRDWVMENYPAPQATGWEAKEQEAGVMDVYEGIYGPSPDFQRGNIPFLAPSDGGELAFDQSGVPVLQRNFDLRFALAVPDAGKCPMPAEGYPIALYAHGTGGNYRSSFRAKHEAPALAAACIATMGVDQIFHGTRPGGPCDKVAPPCNNSVETTFFNINNPIAARANGPQSAIDVVQQARLFTASKITVPAKVSRTGEEIRFDPNSVLFFGHSQGGLNGPLFLAIDDQALGGALSGSGSLISIALLEKTEPVNVAGLVRTGLLGLNGDEASELNFFHPAIALAQTIVDTTDPIHYVRNILRDPRPGFMPKSVIMTEGVNEDFSGDSYAPPHGIEVQSVAMGLPPQEPLVHPITELSWGGGAPITIPSEGLPGNLAGGQASGVMAQWRPTTGDGHFVIYNIPAAMNQCVNFLQNRLKERPAGRVPAP